MTRVFLFIFLSVCFVVSVIEVEPHGHSGLDRLAALKEPCEVVLTSDSKYLVDAVNKKWAVGWRKKGWKKGDGKPALNIDLWERLLPLLDTHDVEFRWIKGHAGHTENERCDRLAVKMRDYYSAL